MSLVVSPAATLTLAVDIDVDTLSPSLSLSIEVSPECSFLATQQDVMAAWLRKAADDLEGSASGGGGGRAVPGGAVAG